MVLLSNQLLGDDRFLDHVEHWVSRLLVCGRCSSCRPVLNAATHVEHRNRLPFSKYLLIWKKLYHALPTGLLLYVWTRTCTSLYSNIGRLFAFLGGLFPANANHGYQGARFVWFVVAMSVILQLFGSFLSSRHYCSFAFCCWCTVRRFSACTRRWKLNIWL